MDHQKDPKSPMKRAFFIILIVFQTTVIFFIYFKFNSKYEYRQHKIKVPKYYRKHEDNESLSRFDSPASVNRYLEHHPIYSKFKIPIPSQRRKVDLLIIVSSAPKRLDRRTAIRETWWRLCKSNHRINVKCIFMTDDLDPSTKMGKDLLKEKDTFQDLAFQTLEGGVEFGKRFLYHMLWAMKNYNFKYFMRMDDDYFFCLDTFLHEIPMPMRKLYHWGYVHCVWSIVRPEESIILFSRDLVEIFLDQNPYTMKGHPWADQMIASWVKELDLLGLYNHDHRLHHSPVLKYVKNVNETFNDVCTNYIGVHGSYPKYMRLLWTLRRGHPISSLDKHSQKCYLPQVFKWQAFSEFWKYEPKRLIDNPSWDTSKQMGHNNTEYGGRQEGQG